MAPICKAGWTLDIRLGKSIDLLVKYIFLMMISTDLYCVKRLGNCYSDWDSDRIKHLSFSMNLGIMIRDGKQRSFANFSSDWKWMIGCSTKDWKKYKVYKRLEAVEKIHRLAEVQRSERLDLQVYCKVISSPTMLNLFCCTYNVCHAQKFTKESNLNMVQIT